MMITSKMALVMIYEKLGWILPDNIREDLINPIKKDLERLDVLEIENEQLKGNENIVSNYAYQLKEENEKLKKTVTMLYLVAKLYDMEVYNNLDEKDKNLLNEVLGNA